MPADHCLRLEDLQRFQYLGCQPIESGEYQAVNRAEPQSLRGFAPQHVELVSKDKDLGLQCSPRPEQSKQRAPDQPAEIAHPGDYQLIRCRPSAVLSLR
jgi:hypothetical protein